MNKSQISNLLRMLGLLQSFDQLKFRIEQKRNLTANQSFINQNPEVSLPPDYLMYESYQPNYAKYCNGGLNTAEWLVQLLSNHINLNGKKILDWGYGP